MQENWNAKNEVRREEQRKNSKNQLITWLISFVSCAHRHHQHHHHRCRRHHRLWSVYDVDGFAAHTNAANREKFSVRTKNVLDIPFYGSFTLCAPLLYIFLYLYSIWCLWVCHHHHSHSLCLPVCPFSHLCIMFANQQHQQHHHSMEQVQRLLIWVCLCFCSPSSAATAATNFIRSTFTEQPNVMFWFCRATALFGFCPPFTHASKIDVMCEWHSHVRRANATHTKKSQ